MIIELTLKIYILSNFSSFNLFLYCDKIWNILKYNSNITKTNDGINYNAKVINRKYITIFNGEENDVFFALNQMIMADIFIQGASSISGVASIFNKNIIICFRKCEKQFKYSINLKTTVENIMVAKSSNYSIVSNIVNNTFISVWDRWNHDKQKVN